MTNKKVYGIYIGRFQPLTVAHVRNIIDAAERVDKLILLVGSANASISPNNPLTYDQRANMIFAAFANSEISEKLIVSPVNDYPYNDSRWVAEVRKTLGQIIYDEAESETTLFGCKKDSSTSEYLEMFPDLKFHEFNILNHYEKAISATDLREWIYETRSNNVPARFVFDETHKKVLQEYSAIIRQQADYYNHDIKYQKETQYQGKKVVGTHGVTFTGLPYKPSFMCADAVVELGGHILMIERKFEPGLGQLALPGGHVESHEWIEDAMIRELLEETKIHLPEKILRGSIVNHRLFDYPKRSGRGRVYTVGYHIRLDPSLGFPRVYGSDDANKAEFVPIETIYKQTNNLFEDHLHIIDYFINNN